MYYLVGDIYKIKKLFVLSFDKLVLSSYGVNQIQFFTIIDNHICDVFYQNQTHLGKKSKLIFVLIM